MTFEAFEATKHRNVTFINPIAAISCAITAILMLTLTRKKALIPFFIMLMLIPMNQVIVVATLDFSLYRILIIIGLIRLTICSEFYPPTKNNIDKTIYLLVISICVVYILQWQTVGAVIYRAGYALDIIGSYILFRSFIRDFEDIDRIIKVFVFISVIIAFSMVIEQIAQINIFSIFGSISKSVFFRDGRIRSMGSFGNPIYIGTFGGVMLPFFTYLWTRNRKLSIAGIIAASIITLTSSSSGPVLSYIAAITALLLYPFRVYMRKIKWGILFLIVALHLYMKSPVWAIIDRVSIFKSSTSYHRFVLIDQFIRRFNEWWFLGTKSTEHWGHHVDIQTWDVSNQFIRIGVDGGFISLFFFILLINFCFSSIEKGISVFENNNERRVLVWTMGVMLFAHIIAFMGVSYYGQMLFVWLLTITLISTINDLSKNQLLIKNEM
ncbi:MAG: hypothetical protein A3H98_14285 [Bacteroidetes bacterium RIFCSPLOWO2_02_FULL_36_8]|nr:MAG: hypothetical protein A3H98_14285 [Bacteroidetes bacterium RIFCSPLOWO2_02_FULL_36_8]